MKVVLLQNIKNFGQMGDVKNVSDGYARNFLFPKKLAELATNVTLQKAESLKKKRELASEIAMKEFGELAESLKNTVVEFVKKATKTGKLYSSITSEVIAKKLSETIGRNIKPEMINLTDHEGHIKQTGEHAVSVDFAPDISSQIKVIIRQEEKTVKE